MDLNQILVEALSQEASDVHIKVGTPPIFRVNGVLKAWNKLKPFDTNDVSKMAFDLMNDWQKERFIKNREVDMGYEVYGLGRFRINVFQQRGKMRICLRIVPYQIKSLGELHLPGVLKDIALEQRGLILVTGTTGSGKSTTLASMTDIINNHRNCHIITIEDPIEFIHEDKKSIVDQREIGQDTSTFSAALRVALRQDPDVILVGEIRDAETAEIAVRAAQTGHLVFATLHTNDSISAITRLLEMKIEPFLVGASLVGSIAQRLAQRICRHCRTEDTRIEKDIRAEMAQALGIAPKQVKAWTGVGCVECNQKGYRGRVGLYEFFILNDEIADRLEPGVKTGQLREVASRYGWRSLRSLGWRKVQNGLISIAEVQRLTRRVKLGAQEKAA